MEHHPRSHWIDYLEKLSRPILEPLAKGCFKERFPKTRHQNTNRPIETIYLEAVARLLNGIGPWLELDGLVGHEAQLQKEFRELAIAGLANGLNPEHPDWFHIDKHRHSLVETAILTDAFFRAPKQLWAAQSIASQKQAIEAFKLLRDRCSHFNNWLIFSAMPEAFLCSLGESYDPMRIDYALQQHEQWYTGDGFYTDGPRFHNDFYNSIVIIPMMRDILELVVPTLPHYRGLLEKVKRRQRRMASHQERMISQDGSWPVTGRSITYRCGVFQSLAYSALLQ
ncbi:hypothetical protein BVX99_00660, partial [bacterium F16]